MRTFAASIQIDINDTLISFVLHASNNYEVFLNTS